MRFADLRSIAHNIADSLASRCSVLAGVYELNVFAEVASSPGGFIEVDVLTGTTTGGPISPALAQAVGRFRAALPALCRKHGISEAAFRQLRARYDVVGLSTTFTVSVEDALGRRVTDTYRGSPGARPRTLDDRGRIRTARPPVQRAGG